MTNKTTTTTLTRWAILTPDEPDDAALTAKWHPTRRMAEAVAGKEDRDPRRPRYSRVVRVDITITDPAPAEEGQG